VLTGGEETEEAGFEAAVVETGDGWASAAGGQSSDGALCFGRRLRCAQGRAEETGARRQGLCSSFYRVDVGGEESAMEVLGGGA
jgi:hypothetical protein